MKDCIFCAIINKKAPATVDLETEDILAFRSIGSVAETHILIVPKQHILGFLDLQKNYAIIDKMVDVAQTLIKKKKIQNGYKLVFNGGIYQRVPHLHWHLLGGKLENGEDVINKT